MASPLGHSLAGISICFLFRRKFFPEGFDFKKVLFCIFASCLPDIDLIPGFFEGDINYYHHKATHSIFFAFISALVVWVFMRKKNGGRWALITLALVLSHVAVDCIAIDTAYPYGMPLLWPFSWKYYYFDRCTFLPEIIRGCSVISVFNSHNLHVLFVELIVFLPVVLLFYAVSLRKKRL